jgi:hypothetical protein
MHGVPLLHWLSKAMRDLMEENYRQWHQHSEQQLAADVQAAEEKAAATAEAQRKRYAP